jgi:hypothetical protein
MTEVPEIFKSLSASLADSDRFDVVISALSEKGKAISRILLAGQSVVVPGKI